MIELDKYIDEVYSKDHNPNRRVFNDGKSRQNKTHCEYLIIQLIGYLKMILVVIQNNEDQVNLISKRNTKILVMTKYSVFIKELYGVINNCNFGRSISI